MSKTPVTPTKIGLVGLGSFGQLYATTIATMAECNLAVVVDRRADLTEEIRQLVGQSDIGGYQDVDIAASKADVDAWIIASSTDTHVRFARRLLATGKPVLLEKPLATSLAEAQSLSSLVAQDSSNLMLGHILLFNSEFRGLLAEHRRRATPLRYISTCRHRPVWQGQKLVGESPLHLLMVHDLYLLQALTNGREPATLRASSLDDSHGREVLVTAQIQWNDGPVANLAASFLTPDGMSGEGFDRMELFADGWSAQMNPNPRPLQLWDDKARWPMELEIVAGSSDQLATGMLVEQIRCFIRVVRKRSPVPTGARYCDAMQIQRWIESLAHELHATKRSSHAD